MSYHMTSDDQKRAAAARASEFVEAGMALGLGSGSTAEHFVRELGKRVAKGLKVKAASTSERTEALAREVGIPVLSLDELGAPDLTVDGADEVDGDLRLIKGGGGALLREKIIASASKKMVVVADFSKLVPVLGKFPLPVEIIPFARAVLEKKITALGASCKLRSRADGTPFVTDEGHHILDCSFGKIADPPALARVLSDMPGVVEHGLFIGIAKMAIVGKGSSAIEILAKSARRAPRRKQTRATGAARKKTKSRKRSRP